MRPGRCPCCARPSSRGSGTPRIRTAALGQEGSRRVRRLGHPGRRADRPLLTQYLAQVRSYLPKGTKLSDTTSAVRDALAAAIEAGHAPDERSAVRADDHARGSSGLAGGGPARERSGQGQRSRPARGPAEARIIAAVRDRGAGLTVIRDFLADSDTWLTGALQAARMRGGGAGAAALTQVQELLGQWAEISDRSQG